MSNNVKYENEMIIKNKRKKYAISSDACFPYLLIAPSLILIFAIMFFPILNVFNLSLQNYSLTRLYEKGFVGFQNFVNIFTKDEIFYSSMMITFKWVILEVVLQLILGLIVALLLNQNFRGRGIVRSLTLVPWAVSGVLTTMLWSLMFNQHIGVINDILKRIGIINENIAWLSNTNTVFGSIVVAELWRGVPFFAITLLAALQGIPKDIYESCDVDGCGKFKRLIYITLPYLKESIILSTLLRGIWEFNSIDMIFTMTNGGPMNMTTTLPIYMMKTSIIEGDYGYGSALGVITFVILLVLTIVYLKFNNFGGEIDD
jgi:multiple sugar transport system permease protein